LTARRNTEAQIQRAIFQHLDLRGAPDVYAFHPANGGYRSKVTASILKACGVRAGVPDIVAVKDGKAFALELKTDSGRLSEAQQRAHEALRRAGASVAVAFGLDQALTQLKKWGILR
jgi:predicted RecB family endonuclease